MFEQWPPLSDADTASVARIERRKLNSKVRTARVLDSKLRTIGIDVEALDLQVKENQRRKAAEKHEEDEYNKWETRLGKHLGAIVKQQKQDQSETNAKLARTWGLQKDRKMRPEWDLCDPKTHTQFLTGDGALVPGRFGRSDDAVEASRKAQQVSQAGYLDEQRIERERLTAEECASEERYAASDREIVRQRKAIHDEEEQQRRDRHLRLASMNGHLSQLRDAKQTQEKELAHLEGNAHVRNQAESAWLRECRGKERLNGRRVRQEWKGMTPEELKDIRKKQEEQRKEAKKARENDREFEEKCDEQFRQVGSHAKFIHREMKKEKKQSDVRRSEYQKVQQQQYLVRKREEREERLRPGISEDWWPFGKTDR